mgnify:CR=1 FL=1
MIESISLFCSLPWLTVMMMVLVTSDNVTQGARDVDIIIISAPGEAGGGARTIRSKEPIQIQID